MRESVPLKSLEHSGIEALRFRPMEDEQGTPMGESRPVVSQKLLSLLGIPNCAGPRWDYLIIWGRRETSAG
jgi:hypothetical protein